MGEKRIGTTEILEKGRTRVAFETRESGLRRFIRGFGRLFGIGKETTPTTSGRTIKNIRGVETTYKVGPVNKDQ